MFQMRTSKPNGNKFYNQVADGGVNQCIYGNPKQSGATVLSNCVGYACGRFNEIIGEMKYPKLYCNAESFINQAKKYYPELEITQEPKLGGIMVFGKGVVGNGTDGAGHVMIVEAIYDDGSIYTSESAYKGTAFYNSKRSNSNGRYGMSTSYDYLGCINNPAVKEEEKEIEPTPQLEPVKKTMELVGTIELYDINGNKYPVPSTITKTVEVMGEKIINGEKHLEIYYTGFNPDTVYIKEETGKTTMVLKGTVELYNSKGEKYSVPSTITKTVEILDTVTINGDKYYKVYYKGFNPNEVYIKA